MTSTVLLVRSGAAGAFPKPEPGADFDLVDKVTHEIRPLSPAASDIEGPADLAVFTSRIAVGRLFEEGGLADRVRSALAQRGGRIAAVGEQTASSLREHGIEPDSVAGGSGESLLDALPVSLEGWRVLLPRGEDATTDVPDELRRRGASVVTLLLYRKIPKPPDGALDVRIARAEFAAFGATSASAASWLFSSVTAAARNRLRETPAVVLGRFTRRYLESHGVARIDVTREPSFPSLLDRLGELALADRPSRGIDSLA